MGKVAEDFLGVAGKYYKQNKSKWKKMLGNKFDEDVYSDTIVKCYDSLAKENLPPMNENEMIAYWYKSFINNLSRMNNYACNNIVSEDDEVVKEIPVNECRNIDRRLLHERVRNKFGNKNYKIFRMYVNKIPIEDIGIIVGYCPKRIINKIKKWIKENDY